MSTDWDVIVVGAGPAGSVAARQIARAGRRVLLLDKKRFPRRKVCGACWNHAAVSLLEQIGLSDVVRACHGPELTRFELRAASRRLSLSLPSGRAISRAALDQRLVDAAVAAGVTFCEEVSAAVGEVTGEQRLVHLRRASESDRDETVRAKLVLVADGLGHPSLNGLREISDRPLKHARLGAGCEVVEFPSEYVAGVIHMAVGHGGYVGLVQVENGALNIAAAFETQLVREAGGPARAAARVLAEAGFPTIPALSDAEWLGTPTLTRTTSPVAAERLFVLGDAAGYVEPFTGEGIGWALSSAVAVAPLAIAGVDRWHLSLAADWCREHARLVRRRQRACRVLASLLKHPWIVRGAMTILPYVPWLLPSLVRVVSLRPPEFTASLTSCSVGPVP